jgi:putative peptide zinc metalloprotease protein
MDLNALPTLRQDLVASRVETPEGPRFVLKDPRTGRYYRLREVEYGVARRLDGATPLEDLAKALSAEFGVEADAASLEPFVSQLRRQGLLLGEGEAQRQRQPFVRGSPLYLRFRAFDPDHLLDRLIRKLGFCFTPYFVVGAASLILWAIVTTWTNHAAVMSDLARLWHFQSLLLAWVVVLGVTTLHEFAHGLTCKHFGGHVHEMGFFLIYLQPAFYCNVSDAWLFPEKSKRLWVMAAGAFFELFVWAVATLVWTVVEPGTWVSGLALVVMATSAIKQFFNLNPLLKLDGYYLLSDLLNVPNLRQRAFGYLNSLVRRATGALTQSVQTETSARERTIFLAYGLVAFAFSYWFLGRVVLAMGAYLTARYQAAGFGMFTVFLGLVFPQPLRRLLRSAQGGNGAAAGNAATPASPAPPAPVPVSPARRRAAWLLLGGGLVALSLVTRLPLRVGGPVDLMPSRNADVRATVEGVIDRVYVDEGDVVKTGDTLATLSERDHQARLDAVAADIAEKQAQLRLLKAGPRPEEITLARLAVAKAQERLHYAQADADRVRGLAAKEFASRADLERAEEQVTVLAKEVEQENARLKSLEAGSRPDSIAAMAQEVAGAEAERDRLEGEIARLVLTAPHRGVVTTPRVREKVGEYVKPGDLIAEVYQIDHLTATINVSERDIGEVQVGQRVDLRFRAYPNRTFEGVVSRIAPAAADSGWREERTLRVEVDLPNPENLLRPHMTGYARINAGERRTLDVLTRRVRRFVRVEFWSWW